ncbi:MULTISPECIES: LysE/ArgO family amino acid transporter [Bacillus]|uniref:Lysine transporter LysE n=2 Tax=Bacillus TaxID=1386 RepID=A0A0M4FHT6_9BACI|nr:MULTISPECIES: LysE/ArgO family amino acid transporter [Bacillus]ALC80691.1 hypothetical protein AM592_03130 [Bacillus gobiensis]MBP1079583.1 L-lysine exporter family protein LysE/ArgO [Bacillus capparidis]MED1094984.1 LysE/ArgO family amino acid transporter [Bacillus capparidis]
MNGMLHGFILAFGLILPLGAQNVFIFQQGAYHKSLARAFPAILTASICDTVLIVLAIMGISVLVFGNPVVENILIGAGVLFLFYMGWTTWNSEITQADDGSESFSLKKQVSFAASVSLLNPHAILDTIGVIGTSSLQYSGMEKLLFAFTCILVSWIWFFSLAFCGFVLQKKNPSGRWMLILNKGSACLIWGIAAYMAVSLFT